MKPVVNTVVTNVPGPPVPIYSFGAKLIHMQGLLCLLDGVALGHVVQSYIGQATISFTACRDAMPDPEFYAQCLQDSYEEMCAAAGVPTTPEPASSASPARSSGRKKPAATRRKAPAGTVKA
jgi:hypothetical protein